MIENIILFTLGVLSIFAAVLAAYFSHTVYKYNKLSKNWMLITFSIMLMILTRALNLLHDNNIWDVNHDALQAWQFTLSIMISGFLAFGLWGMTKSLKKMKEIEDKMIQKIKEFEKSKKRGEK